MAALAGFVEERMRQKATRYTRFDTGGPVLDAPGEADVTDMFLRHIGAGDMNERQAEFLLANLESSITKRSGD